MAKKKKEYSLEDYLSGVSLDDFEKIQKELLDRKTGVALGAEEGGGYNLLSEMNKKYKDCFSSEYQSKNYLYYKRLDDLVIEAQAGNKEAINEIVAYSLHNWQPHSMAEKYHVWTSNTDEDDLTQIICMATLSAIKHYTFGDNCFKNFAGFLKTWVQGSLKSTQVDSAPIKIGSRESLLFGNENLDGIEDEFVIVDKNSKRKISYIYIDGFLGDGEDGIDIPDTKNDFAEIEDKEADEEFIEAMKSWPDRIGEVLITYYGIQSPEDGQKTMQKTAEILGLSLKQVRNRLEKGKRLVETMYPEYAETEMCDVLNLSA